LRHNIVRKEVALAVNMALKRAKKAQRRKLAAKARHKFELVESALGTQAVRAATAPVRHCLLHGSVVEDGIVSVIIARGLSPWRLTVASFLVDFYCLGIKDVSLGDLGADEFAAFSNLMCESAPLVPVEPAYARKLLSEAAAWAATIGFRPHRDFIAAEQIFGEVDAALSDAIFAFGKDGKPLYVPGPTESRLQVQQRLAHLRARLGDEGFDFVIGI
jgi:hypothetical protein